MNYPSPLCTQIGKYKKKQNSLIFMKTDAVTVKDSKIHNQGVFALRVFKKGEIVLHWDISQTLPREKVERMKDEELKYISFLNDTYVIMQEPEKYVNHSCDANTTAQNFCDISIRDIKRGEEITANYIEELPPNIEMICNCGSKNCKKVIRS